MPRWPKKQDTKVETAEKPHKKYSSLLKQYSNKNKCYRCGKPLPASWIGAYCTACENEWDV